MILRRFGKPLSQIARELGINDDMRREMKFRAIRYSIGRFAVSLMRSALGVSTLRLLRLARSKNELTDATE